ncbi:MAG TPA: molybdate ABC transporter permease subunit [Kofleriaceae bacterium]|nr:molybdate ABC transporter permease subunit [Kofleriaceae bacterium]
MTWDPLWLSYQVAALATLLALVLGVGLATVLARRRLPGRELIDALITIPMVLPPTVIGFYLLTALGKESWIGGLYESIFGTRLLFTFEACVIAAFLAALPLVVKSARTALEGVDPTLEQAARTLGAGPVRVFFTVTLPLASRGIVAGVVLGFARALGEFGVTVMIAGNIPGETQTASLYVYDRIIANQDAEAYGMVAVLTATALGALWSVNRLNRSRGVARV